MDNANKQASINAMQYNLAQESAKKQYRLLLFEKRYEIYQEFVNFADIHVDKLADESSLKGIKRIKERAAFVFDVELENWLNEIQNQIELILSTNSNFERESDNFGIVTIVNNDHNDRFREKLNDHEGLLQVYLSPAERLHRFYSYLRVSEH